MFTPRFLVVSLGNPLPKYPSLHSAGHYCLRGLVPALAHPPFSETKLGKQKCLVSQGPKYTLVQSPTLMNVSGPFISKVWHEMVKQHDPASLSLVIVHDELERDFGVVRLVGWDLSHKGHNGIKSVKGVLSQGKFPESPFARIAVGIGRPKERDAATVSNFVLSPISAETASELEGRVALDVRHQLQLLEDEWRTELGK